MAGLTVAASQAQGALLAEAPHQFGPTDGSGQDDQGPGAPRELRRRLKEILDRRIELLVERQTLHDARTVACRGNDRPVIRAAERAVSEARIRRRREASLLAAEFQGLYRALYWLLRASRRRKLAHLDWEL